MSASRSRRRRRRRARPPGSGHFAGGASGTGAAAAPPLQRLTLEAIVLGVLAVKGSGLTPAPSTTCATWRACTSSPTPDPPPRRRPPQARARLDPRHHGGARYAPAYAIARVGAAAASIARTAAGPTHVVGNGISPYRGRGRPRNLRVTESPAVSLQAALLDAGLTGSLTDRRARLQPSSRIAPAPRRCARPGCAGHPRPRRR